MSSLKNLRSIELDTSGKFMNLLIKKQMEAADDVDGLCMPDVYDQDERK